MTSFDQLYRQLDDALARLARAEQQSPDLFPAVVDSVQQDGSLNLLIHDGIVTSIPSSKDYLAQPGDVAQVLYVRGQYFVLGRAGKAEKPAADPHPVSAVTVSGSAPSGGGWTLYSDVYARQNQDGITELWLVRDTGEPAPAPPSSGTVSATSNAAWQWRPGTGWTFEHPHQGCFNCSWGLYRGLWMFPDGAWNALAGKQITGVRVSIGRIARGHGYTYGGVPVTLWTHPHANKPNGAPQRNAGPFFPGQLSLGERQTFELHPSFGESLRDISGTAGVMAFTQHEREYIIFRDDLTVHVDWSD